MVTKNVLGRGVGALLQGSLDSDEENRFFQCDIDKIRPNPDQPRKHFDEEKLNQLAESIKEHGVIQPLLVTRTEGNRYNLIAGERRLRAAMLAGEDEVPVVLMEAKNEDENLELALIENIQRHDLNPIEEASAYLRLIDEFGLTQEDVAKKVGKNRSTITNILRLLKLPEELQEDVSQGRLSEGHARVLLSLQDNPTLMKEIRDKILAEQLSVRETERLCKQCKVRPAPKKTERKTGQDELPNQYCLALTNQLVNHLNTKVKILQNGSRGKLEIEYFSSDDLDRLVSILTN